MLLIMIIEFLARKQALADFVLVSLGRHRVLQHCIAVSILHLLSVSHEYITRDFEMSELGGPAQKNVDRCLLVWDDHHHTPSQASHLEEGVVWRQQDQLACLQVTLLSWTACCMHRSRQRL